MRMTSLADIGLGEELAEIALTTFYPDGKPHANVAFAAHYYEVATELRRPYEKTRGRLHALLARITRTGHGMGMPVWFGEWGNIPASLPNGRECIRDHLDGFDAGESRQHFGPRNGLEDSLPQL